MIKRTFIALLLLLVACYVVQFCYSSAHRNSAIGICKKYNEVFNGNSHFDVVYFGSSRTAFHFNPSLINLGDSISQFNAGISGVETSVNMAVIKEFIKSHNYKPNYAVVNFDFFFWKRPHDGVLSGYTRFIPYLSNDILYKAVCQMDKRFFFFNYFSPYTLVHLNDSRYYDWYRFSTGNKIAIDNDYLSNGFETYLKKTQEPFFVIKDKLHPNLLRERQLSAAKEIFQFFEDNNIKLIPIITPIYSKNKALIMGDSSHFNLLSDLCDQYKTPLLNYFDLELNDQKLNFYDELHLNLKGVEQFSKIVEKDLVQLMELN